MNKVYENIKGPEAKNLEYAKKNVQKVYALERLRSLRWKNFFWADMSVPFNPLCLANQKIVKLLRANFQLHPYFFCVRPFFSYFYKNFYREYLFCVSKVQKAKKILFHIFRIYFLYSATFHGHFSCIASWIPARWLCRHMAENKRNKSISFLLFFMYVFENFQLNRLIAQVQCWRSLHTYIMRDFFLNTL